MSSKKFMTAIAVLLASAICAIAQPEIPSQWNGKKVAFLGDSITDARQIGTTNDVFWHNLQDILGIEPYVYGISGHQMSHIIGQGQRLEKEHGQDVDAIIVFIGTNDYNHGVPLGEWYTYTTEVVNRNAKMVECRRRDMIFDDSTFRGRTNNVLRWLKTHYPDKQVIFLTPLHRAYATFSETNVQPDERYSNVNGIFVDEYIQVIKEIADVWAVPVIDLAAISGLYPLADEHAPYFRNSATDRLHPNTQGHLRMAYALAYQLLGYPASFPAITR